MVPRKASERPFDAKTTAALLPILSKRRIRKDELQTILDLATKRLTSDEVLDLACAEEAVSTAARWFLVWRVLAEKLPREVVRQIENPSTLPGGTVTLSRGALKIVEEAAREAETTPEAIVEAAIRLLPALMEFRERFRRG